MDKNCIPITWIAKYIDTITNVATEFKPGTAMYTVVFLRGQHILEMLEAYQEELEKKQPTP